MSKKFVSLDKKIVTKKEFSYTKGNCNLGFTLKVDTESELKDFRLCLEEGIKDIDEILKGSEN